ncbi:MAG: ribosome-binding factor A [Kiritimatiellia bacterium]|jgi:ribosome-binding factor A
MASNRITRVNELLQREIANCMYTVVNAQGFDVSTITVTHVSTSPDLRNARVLVSVRGTELEARDQINMLKRLRTDIQEAVYKNVTLKYSPRFRFELDDSLFEGDRVLAILQKLDAEEGVERELDPRDSFEEKVDEDE